MFYSVFVLGKKGPLAKVWLAAHWDKKISKAQILETNISESVDSILQPRIKLSLRTSSHLMLGVVRIYARKTQYLLQDCQDAAFKIKSAFRPDAVDLPAGRDEASIAAINLPENLDFDLLTEPPDMQMDLPTTTAANIRNITLQEDISSIHFDDASGIADWDATTSVRGVSRIETGREGRSGLSNGNGSHPLDIFDKPIEDDGFAGVAGLDNLDDVFSVPISAEDKEKMEQEKRDREDKRPLSRMSAASDDYSAPASMAPSNGPSTPGSVPPVTEGFDSLPGDDIFSSKRSALGGDQLPSSMVLDPLEGTTGFERGRRKKRRKLGIIIDDVKTLSGEEMKSQLSDTADILIPLDLAPPSKKLMHWKKTGGSEKLFALPERTLYSKVLAQYYSRNLITNRIEVEEEELLDSSMTNGSVSHLKSHSLIPDFQMEDLEMPPPSSPRKEGLRPSKPREKYEKERNSPKKRVRREQDKENDDDRDGRRLPPKSPRGSKTPRHSEVGREASLAYQSRHSEYQQEFDDFEQPYSVGPASVGPQEEQLEDETVEQFEERVRNKRSNVLLMYLSNQLEEHQSISFQRLVKDNRRKQVAQKFYSLLVLKKQQAIELHQDTSVEYGEIFISQGTRYEDALAACKV